MRLRSILIIAVACAVAGAARDAVSERDPNRGESHMEVVSDDVVGVALYPDGETPVKDLPVRVWSIDRQRMVYRTITDADGVFEIPKIRLGRCFVFVGRVKVDLRVVGAERSDLHQQHDIVVVIPRGMLVGASPRLMDILIVPFVVPLPKEPRVVSP